MNYKNLEEFWAYYMSQHSKPLTRVWHFIGTLSGLICFLCAAVSGRWALLLAAPLLGYGMAWYSHFFVEGNRPAVFVNPFLSFICDFRMFGLMLAGNINKEIKRLGKRPVLQVF